MKKEIYILLHNIRSIHNVGSIFRTASALGVTKIFISGFTPTPTDRFGKKRKDFAKVSLGSEEILFWQYENDPIKLLKKLKKDGVEIISIEQDKKSIDYKKVKPKYPTIFIVGEETKGIDNKILKMSDKIAEIPMKGNKESLNVSVSFGVALYRILNL